MNLRFTSLVIFVVLILAPVVLAQRADVKRILRDLEENTDRFSKSLDSALDKSNLNGSKSEDEINRYVHEFEEATDRLKDKYEDTGAAPRLANEVLVRGQRIDAFMRRNRLGGRAESDWRLVRNDLSALARAYGIRWRW